MAAYHRVVEQKSKQPVKLPAVIKDYSGNKPWEAFNMIKTDLKTTDNKKVLDSLFDYLCTFSISANNQGLAAVWKNRCGSDNYNTCVKERCERFYFN